MDSRRPAVDVARILALLIVVIGHLLLAVVDRSGDKVRGANLLALRPGWAWIAALAPMPVFFAAGGWANATVGLRSSAPRLRTLVGVGAAAVGIWSAAVLVARAAIGEPGLVGDGARIATQPLWFLAAYLPFAACGARLARLTERHPVLWVGGCLAGLAILDAVRFLGGAAEWIGWPGFFLAWGTPWLLGAWWRSRASIRPTDAPRAARGSSASVVRAPGHGGRRAWDERVAGAALAVGALVAGMVLVAAFGYSPALIDAVPDARSNTTPPTLYTAVAGMAQVGALMVGARGLDRLGRRGRRIWSQAGELAVGIYVWHLTALALAVALIAAGLPAPHRLGGWWWASRPLWWSLVLAITALLVALTVEARRRARRVRPRWAPGIEPAAVSGALGIAASVAGAALIGLRGPRTVPLALGCSTLFVAAWWLLGGAVAPPRQRNLRESRQEYK